MKNLAFLGYSNYAITEDGRVYSFNSNKFKLLKEDKAGYLRVYVSANSKKKWFLVHRLVAMAFIPNIDNKKTVNHKDGDKSNNHVSNLEWSTYTENLNHAIDTGLRELQEFRVDRKLTDDVVHKICKYLDEGFRNIDIANMLGIDKYFVKNIKSGTQYKDIVSQYNFTRVVKTRRKVSTSKLKNICDMLNNGADEETICKENSISQETIERIKGGDFMPSLVSQYLYNARTIATTIETTT